MWAGLVRVLQWLLIIAALVGAGWLALLAFGPTPGCPSRRRPSWGLPVPTLMLLGGIALGVLLALVCRVLVRLTARRRARAADKRLRAAISVVSEELVVDRSQAELAAYSSCGTAWRRPRVAGSGARRPQAAWPRGLSTGTGACAALSVAARSLGSRADPAALRTRRQPMNDTH